MFEITKESELNKSYAVSCKEICRKKDEINKMIFKLNDVKDQLIGLLDKYDLMIAENNEVLDRDKRELEKKGEVSIVLYPDSLHGNRDKAHVSRAIHNLEDDLRKFRYNM